MDFYARLIMIVCIVAFTAIAAVVDLRTWKIPNKLTVTCAVCGLLFHLISGAIDGGFMGAGRGFLFSLGGFATGFGVLFILVAFGSSGAGDLKLMASLGAWLGAWMTFKVFIAASVLVFIALVFTMMGVFFKKGFGGVRSTLKSGDNKGKKKKLSPEEEQQQRRKKRLAPFGVPVALATWIMLAADALIQSSQTIVKQ